MPKLIKTVKGKEIEMYADESQAVLLLRDPRYRLAEDEITPPQVNDPDGAYPEDLVLDVDKDGVPLPEIDPESPNEEREFLEEGKEIE